MAIAATHLDSNGNTGNQSTAYATASVSPPATTEIILGVFNLAGYATPNDPVVSGLGMTWTILEEQAYSTHTAYLVLGEGTPDASGTISMDPDNADAATGCAWSFWAFEGVDTAAPIVQSSVDINGGVASGTYDTTLAAFADATNNVTFVGAAKNGTALPAEEAGNGYATAQGGSHATPNVGLATSWKTGEDTSPSMTGASVVHAAFAAEIAVAPASGVSGDGALTIQLSGAADGGVVASGDGAGTIQLSADADGSLLVSGDGAGTIRLSAAGDGSVLVQGDGVGTIQLTALGEGVVLVSGDGAGSIQLVAEGEGAVDVFGEGAGQIALSAVGDAVAIVAGDGAATIQLSVASAATVSDGPTGNAQLTIALSAVATGGNAIQGDALVTLALAIAAEAVVTNPNVGGFIVGRGTMGMPRTGVNRRRRR